MRHLVSGLLIGLCAPLAHAQEVPSGGTRVTLRSTALDQERVLWVWTPPGYAERRPGLPVLYLLDPEVHYRHATALVQFLSLYLRMPEMIVVGVVSPDRDRDFLPERPGGNPPGSTAGGAARFLAFLAEEVQPLIQRSYRAAPFSVLVGHSFGGLFTVYAAINRPQAFGAFIAMSPSLDWADSLVLRAAVDLVQRGDDVPRFLSLSVAEAERPGITASTASLADALQRARPEGMRWESAVVAGENHLTMPLPGLLRAVRWLFTGWALSPDGTAARVLEQNTLAPLDEHFANLSRQYGYQVEPPELILSIVGDRLYRREAFPLAIALFARRVALYPDSPEAHDELARGYAAAGQRDEAFVAWERAIALAREQRHPALEAIQDRLNRARSAGRR